MQIDDTYFLGQRRAYEALDGEIGEASTTDHRRRVREIQESLESYRSIEVDLDTLSEESLWAASTRFRDALRDVPELDALIRQFPGQSFVVPEWLQTGDRLHYGARGYFLRAEDTTTPEAVLHRNIDAILGDSFQPFERFQGQLHSYPKCCIDFYQGRSSDEPAPEWRSIEPFVDRINEDALGNGLASSIDAVLPQFSEWENRHAFFTREFFPEPGCEQALSTGRALGAALPSEYSPRLVEDYFAVTFGYNYLVARAVHSGGSHRPRPGALGREHLLFYLPVEALSSVPRYSDADAGM